MNFSLPSPHDLVLSPLLSPLKLFFFPTVFPISTLSVHMWLAEFKQGCYTGHFSVAVIELHGQDSLLKKEFIWASNSKRVRVHHDKEKHGG